MTYQLTITVVKLSLVNHLSTLKHSERGSSLKINWNIKNQNISSKWLTNWRSPLRSWAISPIWKYSEKRDWVFKNIKLFYIDLPELKSSQDWWLAVSRRLLLYTGQNSAISAKMTRYHFPCTSQNGANNHFKKMGRDPLQINGQRTVLNGQQPFSNIKRLNQRPLQPKNGAFGRFLGKQELIFQSPIPHHTVGLRSWRAWLAVGCGSGCDVTAESGPDGGLASSNSVDIRSWTRCDVVAWFMSFSRLR